MNNKLALRTIMLAIALTAISVTARPDTLSARMQNNDRGRASNRYATGARTAIVTQNPKMNEMIAEANTAAGAKNWKQAIELLERLIVMDPTRWDFYASLSFAQMSLGRYQDAIDSAEKGVAAAEADKGIESNVSKIKTAIGQMLTTEGNAYNKLGKSKEAAVAFSKAAEVGANRGLAYFNLCVSLFNMGDTKGAQSACDKAIAVDPAKAEAYFIKGSILIGNSTTNAKGELVPPPGTIESLKKYLELSPKGDHVGDARDLLKALGVATAGSATVATKKP